MSGEYMRVQPRYYWLTRGMNDTLMGHENRQEGELVGLLQVDLMSVTDVQSGQNAQSRASQVCMPRTFRIAFYEAVFGLTIFVFAEHAVKYLGF